MTEPHQRPVSPVPVGFRIEPVATYAANTGCSVVASPRGPQTFSPSTPRQRSSPSSSTTLAAAPTSPSRPRSSCQTPSRFSCQTPPLPGTPTPPLPCPSVVGHATPSRQVVARPVPKLQVPAPSTVLPPGKSSTGIESVLIDIDNINARLHNIEMLLTETRAASPMAARSRALGPNDLEQEATPRSSVVLVQQIEAKMNAMESRMHRAVSSNVAAQRKELEASISLKLTVLCESIVRQQMAKLQQAGDSSQSPGRTFATQHDAIRRLESRLQDCEQRYELQALKQRMFEQEERTNRASSASGFVFSPSQFAVHSPSRLHSPSKSVAFSENLVEPVDQPALGSAGLVLSREEQHCGSPGLLQSSQDAAHAANRSDSALQAAVAAAKHAALPWDLQADRAAAEAFNSSLHACNAAPSFDADGGVLVKNLIHDQHQLELHTARVTANLEEVRGDMANIRADIAKQWAYQSGHEQDLRSLRDSACGGPSDEPLARSL